jgi:hemolysin III
VERRPFVIGCSDCDLVSEASAFKGRPETLREEIANSISHGIACLATLIGAPFLILHAVRDGGVSRILGVCVFVVSVFLLYLASTLYHALPRGWWKHILRRFEHAVIYVLIAGTYTPFTLGILRGPWGWTLFGVIWALALAGIALKSVGGVRFPRAAMVLYLSMGWVVIVAVRPLWQRMPHEGVWWIVAGGLAYTIGTIFYASHRRYSHFIWHLFVMAGTALHFYAIWEFAA